MKNELQEYLDRHALIVQETNFPTSKLKGLYFDGMVLVDRSIDTEAELQCIIAEECGHFETSYGNILDEHVLSNHKQERTARRWAHRKMLPLTKFIECFNQGCSNRYETAEFLGVTEKFLEEAIEEFKKIYGVCAAVDDYIIYFEPLGVMKLF